MAETNLAFSKIVATPTPTAWSQAYSAGRLFAALSLQTDIIPQTDEEHLNSHGKDLISTLESEFFTTESKDLESIKQAIITTITRVKPEIKISFIVCYLNDNVLYLFAVGGAKAVLKRGNKIGTVLQGEENTEVKSASGYVQEGDIIVLETKPFQRIISSSTLASSLESDNPDEIAETLAPHVHDKTEGGASSVILIYKKGELQDLPRVPLESLVNGKTADENTPETKDVNEEVKAPDNEVIPVEDLGVEKINETSPIAQDIDEPSPFLTDQMPRKKKMSVNLSLGFFKKLQVRIPGGLSHSRKIILTIAVILIVLIVAVSILALNNKQSSSNKELFASVYGEAKTKYDEGQNLKDLNASLAQESLKEAKRILGQNISKFKEGSEEKKQILALLDQVNKEVSSVSNGESVEAKEVDKESSDLLSYEINNANANYFVQNEDKVFFLDGSGVSEINKKSDKKTEVIKKSWEEDGGIGLFGSNVYVLDKKDGILKFVPSESTYSKNNYFSGDSPDLSSSSAMAIDGSIYILYKSGDIEKYTKAKKETFSVSGLEKPLSTPTKIFTNEDIDNVYILDDGNGRVVVIDKTGKFVKAYSAGVLKGARDLDVNEENKKIFILSGGRVYQIDLK